MGWYFGRQESNYPQNVKIIVMYFYPKLLKGEMENTMINRFKEYMLFHENILYYCTIRPKIENVNQICNKYLN